MFRYAATVTETFTGEPTFRQIHTPHGRFIKCSCGWWADGPFETRADGIGAWCVHALIHERTTNTQLSVQDDK